MNKKITFFSIVILIILSIICVCSFFKIDDRIVLHIDDFSLNKDYESPITVGRNSDIVFNKIPNDYMEILVEKDSVRWTINEKYHDQDSLLYYKINEKNPNKYTLQSSDVVFVRLNDNPVEKICVDDLKTLLKKCESKYVMLNSIIAKKHYNSSPEESVEKYVKDRNIKSFLYSEDGKWKTYNLVILDTSTTIKRDDDVIAYKMEGCYALDEKTAKVQFLQMASSLYRNEKVDNEYFNINGVNYTAKPNVLTTEWRAGHISIKRENERKVRVYFQKPITYVERVEDLKNMASLSSGVLTYRQRDDSFPIGNNLTVPAFSNAVSTDVCSLKLSNDSIYCEETYLPHVWKWTPQFNKYSVGAQNNVSARIGYIDNNFLWACLFWPILVFVICISGCLLVFNTNKLKEPDSQFSGAAKSFRGYSFLIFFVALVYSVCRIMISVKLAYTFPFFEKVFAVAVVDACLIILLVYGLTLLLNHKFVSAELIRFDSVDYPETFLGKIKRIRRPMVGLFVFFMGFIICSLLFHIMNSTYSDSVLQSYLSGEVIRHDNIRNCSSWNITAWSNRNGMSDLFFNIPYTLILANVLVFGASILIMIHDYRIRKGKGNLKCKVLNILEKCNWTKTICNWIKKITEFFLKAEKWVDESKKPIIYIFRFILVYVSPSALICFFRLLSGNFATVFVTLFVVLLICWTVSHIEYKKCGNFWMSALLSLFIFVIYMLVALVGGHDDGYITNAIGLFCFLAIIYSISSKAEFESDWNNKGRWMLWLSPLFAVGIVWVYAGLFVSPKDINYNRKDRRLNLMANYKEYSESGFRYADTDAEFMRIMRHYMFSKNASDPLSNEDHILHMSISNGQSPVILNDVSIQSGFFSSYGWWMYVVFFGLLVVLAITVSESVLAKQGHIGQWSLRRLLAMLMWVGTSIYLILSYVGALPFTGRLNPGYGVDSVGEALESALLLAFMLSVNLAAEKGENE